MFKDLLFKITEGSTYIICIRWYHSYIHTLHTYIHQLKYQVCGFSKICKRLHIFVLYLSHPPTHSQYVWALNVSYFEKARMQFERSLVLKRWVLGGGSIYKYIYLFIYVFKNIFVYILIFIYLYIRYLKGIFKYIYIHRCVYIYIYKFIYI